MNIADRVFLVTGACSGLGSAVARMLLEEDGKVVGVDIDADRGDAAVQEHGERFRFHRTDVTSEPMASQQSNVRAARSVMSMV